MFRVSFLADCCLAGYTLVSSTVLSSRVYDRNDVESASRSRMLRRATCIASETYVQARRKGICLEEVRTSCTTVELEVCVARMLEPVRCGTDISRFNMAYSNHGVV